MCVPAGLRSATYTLACHAHLRKTRRLLSALGLGSEAQKPAPVRQAPRFFGRSAAAGVDGQCPQVAALGWGTWLVFWVHDAS
jgi:hypothetical protein